MKRTRWMMVLICALAVCVGVAPTVSAKPKEITEDTKAKAAKDGIDLQNKAAYDAQKVVLRDILELENAMQTYILSYEAYLEARQSSDKKVQERIPAYLKNYREAYANFLAEVREDRIDHPLLPKDHANLYKKKWDAVKSEPIEFRTPGIDQLKAQIQQLVSQGATPEQIKKHIKATLHLVRPDPKAAPQPAQPPRFTSIADAKKAAQDAKNNAICNGWDPCSAEAYLDTIRAYRDSLYALKAPIADLEEADDLLIEARQILWNISNGYAPNTGTPGNVPYPPNIRPPRFDDRDRDEDRFDRDGRRRPGPF